MYGFPRLAISLSLIVCLLLCPTPARAQYSYNGQIALEYVQALRAANFYVRSAMEQLEARGWVFESDKCLRTVSPDGTEVVYITYTDGDPSTWEGVIWTDWEGSSLTAIGQNRVATGEIVVYSPLDAPAETASVSGVAREGDAGTVEPTSNVLTYDFEVVLDVDPCIEDKKWECEQQFEAAQSQLTMAFGASMGACALVGAGTALIGGVACAGFASLGTIAASRRNRRQLEECMRRVPLRCPRQTP
jgi:hypothetical protein